MARGRALRRPLWLIAKQENGQDGVFTFDRGSGGEALAVFSFEEEAEMFLRFGRPGVGWRARKSIAGELVSLLYGPCVGIKKVALDPLPLVRGETTFDLAGSGREVFLRDFAGERTEDGRAREESQNGAYNGHIPDYMTRDFDSSGEPRHDSDGRHRPSDVPDSTEELTQDNE